MTMYVESIANKLKYLRDRYNFKQKDVSIETKIPRETISRYESGDRIPSAEHLAILADFYQVSADWLLGTKGDNKALDFDPRIANS